MTQDTGNLEDSGEEYEERNKRRVQMRKNSARYYKKNAESIREKRRIQMAEKRTQIKVNRRKWDPPRTNKKGKRGRKRKIVDDQTLEFPTEDLNRLTPDETAPLGLDYWDDCDCLSLVGTDLHSNDRIEAENNSAFTQDEKDAIHSLNMLSQSQSQSRPIVPADVGRPQTRYVFPLDLPPSSDPGTSSDDEEQNDCIFPEDLPPSEENLSSEEDDSMVVVVRQRIQKRRAYAI